MFLDQTAHVINRQAAHSRDAWRLVSPHPLYLALGDAESRQASYRELFRYELEPGLVDQIRKATNGNFLLGDTHFAAGIEATLGRRV